MAQNPAIYHRAGKSTLRQTPVPAVEPCQLKVIVCQLKVIVSKSSKADPKNAGKNVVGAREAHLPFFDEAFFWSIFEDFETTTTTTTTTTTFN